MSFRKGDSGSGERSGDRLGAESVSCRPLLVTESTPDPRPPHPQFIPTALSCCFLSVAVVDHPAQPMTPFPLNVSFVFLKVTCVVDVSVCVFGGEAYLGGFLW